MTLFDKYGGRDFWVDVVDIFYGRLLQDEVLAGYFANHDVSRVTALNGFLLESTLGFTNPHFSVGVRTAHRHLKVAQKDFHRYIEMLCQVCREKGVAEEDIQEISTLLVQFEPDITEPPK